MGVACEGKLLDQRFRDSDRGVSPAQEGQLLALLGIGRQRQRGRGLFQLLLPPMQMFFKVLPRGRLLLPVRVVRVLDAESWQFHRSGLCSRPIIELKLSE